MLARPTILGMLAIATLLAYGCQGENNKLATELQAALDAGDADAMLALAELSHSPAEVRFLYLGLLKDCSGETKCTVSQASDEESKQEQAEAAQAQDFELPAPVEGVLVVSMVSADSKGTMKLPYGQVDGQLRILGGRPTAAKLVELRAMSSEALMDELFAAGIADPETGERRTDWKTEAQELPAGGGEFGAVLSQQIAALNEAVKAQDPDAAMAAGGRWGSMAFAAKRPWDGQDIPFEARKLALRAQSVRFLKEAKVLGGYQRGEEAVLSIEGIDGAGWLVRGPVIVRKSGDWDPLASRTVRFPM
jgi:hypothetical protein